MAVMYANGRQEVLWLQACRHRKQRGEDKKDTDFCGIWGIQGDLEAYLL